MRLVRANRQAQTLQQDIGFLAGNVCPYAQIGRQLGSGQGNQLNGCSSGGIIGIGLGAHDPLSTFRAIAIKAPIAALMRQQPTQPIRSFLRNIQPAFDGRNQRLIGEIRINLRTRRIPFTNRQRADGAIRVHKRLQIDARRRLRRTGCMCNRATINPGNSHANRCH